MEARDQRVQSLSVNRPTWSSEGRGAGTLVTSYYVDQVPGGRGLDLSPKIPPSVVGRSRLRWLETLEVSALNGTPEQRRNWRLIGQGYGIRWPDLDEDVCKVTLIEGEPSWEYLKTKTLAR